MPSRIELLEIPGPPKVVWGRQAGELFCYCLLLLFFSPSFWLCRPPNALNGNTACLYANFKLTDKRFALLLTSHGSFAR